MYVDMQNTVVPGKAHWNVFSFIFIRRVYRKMVMDVVSTRPVCVRVLERLE